MSLWPEESDIREIRGVAQTAAQRLRLPFRSRSWRGESGNWLGAGIGNSIDFQDHRPYLPGDDPRYIDWQAYARTGHYSMKLYREEVSPRVDLALDLSGSMTFDDAKRRRALEMFFFCLESGLRAGSSMRCHALSGGACMPWAVESALAGKSPAGIADNGGATDWMRVPWRQGSLRAVISDLLFPGSPEPLIAMLAAAKGRGLLLAPYSRGEANPDWNGNVEFVDCESGHQRMQNVSADLRVRYTEAYAHHFELWKDRSRRHGVLVARVDAAPAFLDALQHEPLRMGAVEFLT
jgi:uncharacterized protein (DUF58 family)